MVSESIQRLIWLCANIPPLLEAIPEDEFSAQATPDKWSRKQILGHLIDSAANNHQRFVRIQFEDNPNIAYDQNNWVNFSYYQEMHKADLIAQWRTHNIFLAKLISHIPAENLHGTGQINGKYLSLEWFIVDYVQHMEHHLKQIVAY
jgi:hypothetical protein